MAKREVDDGVKRDFGRRLLDCLNQYNRFFLGENDSGFSSVAAKMRAVFCPINEGRFFTGLDTTYEWYNPTHLNLLDRTVSGILIDHFSPRDHFFDLRYNKLEELEPEYNDPARLKALKHRSKDIHDLIQTPGNTGVEGAFVKDKVVFGVAGKSLHYDGEMFRQVHHIPENLAYGCVGNMGPNVFGYKEELTAFDAMLRFPEFWDPMVLNWLENKTLADMGTLEFRHVCVPYDVFALQAKVYLGKQYHDKKALDKLLKKFIPKNNWIHVIWCQEGVVSITGLAERDIIVSTCFPPAKTGELSKGLCERAVPVAVAMTEFFEMMISAFERTYAPPYVLPSEAQTYGMDLSRNGIVFTGHGRGEPPQNLSLGAGMDGIIKTNAHMAEMFGVCIYADVFELLDKVNMPTREVNIRNRQDYRKMALYVTQDEEDNLTPLVHYLNHNLGLKLGPEGEKMRNTILQARYSSPLSQSYREEFFNNIERMSVGILNLGKVFTEIPKLQSIMDLNTMIAKVISMSNQEDTIVDPEITKMHDQLDIQRKGMDDELKAGQIANQELGNENLRQQIEGGGGPPEGGGGEEASIEDLV